MRKQSKSKKGISYKILLVLTKINLKHIKREMILMRISMMIYMSLNQIKYKIKKLFSLQNVLFLTIFILLAITNLPHLN